ncbi:MAG: penicillin-binding protein 2 [Candidatus Uhrbacteria bacterium]|nr:penicillin-binding protein 2 [Patescibacteria group bacterium]MBU1906706.1 penicillin-binding protein 2 [Patescibacteria group bacterium]
MKLFKRKSTPGTNPFGVGTDDFSRYELNRRNPEAISFSDDEMGRGERAREFLGKTIPPKMFRIILIILILVVGIFTARAAQLQIVNGADYRVLAEGNRIRIQTIAPQRGIIYDRNGIILGENISTFTVSITTIDLPSLKEEREWVIERVATITDVDHGEIEAQLAEFADVPFEPVPVVRGVPHEAAMKLMSEEQTLPGVKIFMSTERQYASWQTPSLSHILGYMGKISPDEIDAYLEEGYRRTDEIGRQGIEMSYESVLHGTPGKKVIEVDALGHEALILTQEDPQDGSNIVLAIDYELQNYIEGLVREMEEKVGRQKVSIVVMDPNNGEVLSLMSLPAYNNNAFSGGIDTPTYLALINDPAQPLFPRAISGEYPSGSTFKPVVAAAALAEGIITEHTTFLSTGGIAILQWFFPDWRAGGHGVTDVRKALAESVNTFFYTIGGGKDDFIGLGVARITDYASRFGMGSVTGIDLPGEAPGFLPSKEWKEEVKGERWYVGDTYHLAIGQGDILVTPLQMALEISVFANGGTLYQPHLIRGILTGDEGEIFAPVVLNEQVVDPDVIRIVREGLRQGVTSGSSRYLLSVTEPVAGKTGTAQAGGDAENHAWWTGFGPYDDPELAMAILIENGGEGSDVAVPIARDIFNWWFANR